MTPAKVQSFLLSAITALILPVLIPGNALAQKGAGVGTPYSVPAAPASAPAPTPTPVQSAAPPVAPKVTIADFAWLEGRWQGTWGPRVAEQSWTAPKAGMILGTFRLVEDEKTLVIELFTLVEKPEGIYFYIRHFTPALVPWESSDATFLKLVSLDGAKAVFENPVDGEPKHAVLTRLDANTYVSRSEIVPENGDMQVIEITYHRQKSAAAAPPSGGSGARQ
jgi:hypothetical protein